MSLEKILKKISADAQAEADKLIRESQKKAAQIIENAKKEALGTKAALLKEAERQGRLEASRILTQARLEKKISLLSLKKELAGKVLEKAFQKSAAQKKGLKRKVIMKEGEREEPYDEERLREELCSKFETEIIEALKI